MRQICVVYEETRNGRNALRMAVDTAHAFGETSLLVFAAIDDGATYAIKPDEQRVRSAVSSVITALDSELRFELVCFAPPSATFASAAHPVPAASSPLTADPALPGRQSEVSTSAALALPPNALLVLPRASKPAEDGGDTPPRLSELVATACGASLGLLDILMPADETSLENHRGVGPILVPFSDGDSGLRAAQAALDLARRWRGKRVLDGDTPELIFYHTTWSDAESPSAPAIDQMCAHATRVMLAIEAAAKKAGVRFRTIVETHDDVVQGVVEMAQATRASLVMMARGAQIRQGSYVGRTLQQSPIPVYIAGAPTKYVADTLPDDAVATFREQRKVVRAAESEKTEHRPAWRRLVENPLLRSPMFVAAVVALAYIVKASAKIGVGSWINSPMITGDGFHNIADVLEVIAIGVVLFIAARRASSRYPYGRMNMEWFTQLGIGAGLFVAAGNFVLSCCVGLLSYAPKIDDAVRAYAAWLPQHHSVNLTGSTFPWVLGVTAASFAVSLLLSRYQIFVGKRSGHASLIANGEEAASDGWIEAVTVFGITAEYVTGWGALEYVLGLVVAVMIMRTAKELFLDGWRVLLQHSIGDENEERIRTACSSVRGVDGVVELKTFQVGHTAVVMVTCETLAGSHGMNYIKKGVEDAIRTCILADDGEYKGVDLHVKMQRPGPKRSRIGFAIRCDEHGHALVAETRERISHLAVCDVEHGDIVRSKLIRITAENLEALMVEKRIQRLTLYRTTAVARAVSSANETASANTGSANTGGANTVSANTGSADTGSANTGIAESEATSPVLLTFGLTV